MAGTKNKLTDLHNHLFMQLERLNDDDLLKGEDGTWETLDREARRAKAITDVAQQLISSGRLMLDAIKAEDEMPGIAKKAALLLE